MVLRIFQDDEAEGIENKLLKQTLEDTFNFLHYKLDKTGRTASIGVQYPDVTFEIICRKTEEQIVPRGYENVK